MYSLIVLILSSFLFALIVTPLLRHLFRRWGLVDHPDGDRKLHSMPIPRLGGVPVVVACLGAYGLLLLLPLRGVGVARTALSSLSSVLPALAVVFIVGVWDDVRGLKPWQKLAGEIVASLLAVLGGLQVTTVVGVSLPPWLAVFATVLWLVACTNAVNLIDGMDGLAAGIVLLAATTTLAAGVLQNDMPLAYATAPLVGALLGFLRFNFNPATIFLGDSGSLTLGFLLGCCAILWSQKSTTLLSLTAPLLVLAVPLLDAGLAVVRRFLRQQPIFTADRGHIHHRLLAKGLTPRRVVLLLYAAAGACAMLSLIIGTLHDRLVGLILVLVVAGIYFAVHSLGYVEFRAARRLILNGVFRRMLNAQLSLDALAQNLREAGTIEECWRHIAASYATFGFSSIELQLDGTRLTHPLEPGPGQTAWLVTIDLQNGNHLLLRREVGMRNHTTLGAAFAELLQNELPARLQRPKVKAATA